MIGVFSAQVIGLFLEAMFYGVYLVTFGACILPRTFWHDRPGRMRLPSRLSWVIALAAILFVLATLHLAIGLVQLLSLPSNQQTTAPRSWITTTKATSAFVLVLIGDDLPLLDRILQVLVNHYFSHRDMDRSLCVRRDIFNRPDHLQHPPPLCRRGG